MSLAKNTTIQAALRRFKRQCNYSGIFRLFKAHTWHEKRSDKRRRERRERLRTVLERLGLGARLPVAGTHPRGFLPGGEDELGGIPEPEFGGGEGYSKIFSAEEADWVAGPYTMSTGADRPPG